MIPENRVGIQGELESLWSLLEDSILLEDEAKSAIFAWAENAADREQASRLVAFLGREKTFILEFMTRRLHDGSFPGKVPILLGEMRASYSAELRRQEAEERMEEPENALSELSHIF